jgi:hypothetical protein
MECIKYGLLLKMRSLSTLFSKRKAKKPLSHRKCKRFPFKWGFQFLSIHISIACKEGQIPVNFPMSAYSEKFESEGSRVSLDLN